MSSYINIRDLGGIKLILAMVKSDSQQLIQPELNWKIIATELDLLSLGAFACKYSGFI